MKRFFLIPLLLLMVIYTVQAKSVSGVVFIDANQDGIYNKGEKTVSGIVVSNQKDVVLTDDKGCYKIELRKGSFIYVVKPSGYMVTKDNLGFSKGHYFYHPEGAPDYLKYPGVKSTGKAPKEINFALYPLQEKKKFRMLAIGDPQTPDDIALNYFREGVSDMLRQEADMYIVHGDVADNHLDIYPRERSIVSALGIPGYHVAGNHDLNFYSQHRSNDFETFKKEYGPDYYSFDYGDVHFVVLNNIVYDGWDVEKNIKGKYTGGIDEVQLEWLRNDLDLVSDHKLIVVNSHIPFIEGLCQKEEVINLFELLKDRKRILSLSGHMHTVHTYQLNKETHWNNAGAHEGVVVGAACGSWWGNPKDDNGIPLATCYDGTPKGYFVFDFTGNDYDYEYVPIHYSDDFQIRVSCPEGIIGADDLTGNEVVVNWFVGKPHHKVYCAIDGRDRVEMKNFFGTDPFIERTLEVRKTNPNFPPKATKSFHLWKTTLPEDLYIGTHKIEITALGENGKVYKGYSVFEVEKAKSEE